LGLDGDDEREEKEGEGKERERREKRKRNVPPSCFFFISFFISFTFSKTCKERKRKSENLGINVLGRRWPGVP